MLGIKWLQRPSRGNMVRAHHGLANLKSVQFAEQVGGPGLLGGQGGQCTWLASLEHSLNMFF